MAEKFQSWKMRWRRSMLRKRRKYQSWKLGWRRIWQMWRLEYWSIWHICTGHCYYTIFTKDIPVLFIWELHVYLFVCNHHCISIMNSYGRRRGIGPAFFSCASPAFQWVSFPPLLLAKPFTGTSHLPISRLLPISCQLSFAIHSLLLFSWLSKGFVNTVHLKRVRE